jgi:hypothetical protein
VRRTSRAAAIAVAAALAAGVLAPAAPVRASDLVLELGVRVGYVLGRGWTVGPTVGLLRGGVPADFFRQNQLALLAGLAASGDLVIGSAGDLSYRLHVGPEVGVFHPCPALAPSLSGGAIWIFHRGVPARVGLEGGFSLLGAAMNPFGNFGQVTAHPLLVGPGYRYAGLLDGERSHDLGLDVRLWSFPFASDGAGEVRLCGSLHPGSNGVAG